MTMLDTMLKHCMCCQASCID